MADTISGTSMSGRDVAQRCQRYVYIYKRGGCASLYVANDGAGVMGLNVEGDIALAAGGWRRSGGVQRAHTTSTTDSRYYTETELATSGSASVHWNNPDEQTNNFCAIGACVGHNERAWCRHTVSGLTTGYVLRASSATTAAFAQLAHSDLSGVGVNSHADRYSHRNQ